MNKEHCKECTKSKHRTLEEKKKLQKRLCTIEGQVRGIKQMIDDDRYCHEILIQISAVNSALKSLANSLLKSHMESCIVEEIKQGNNEIIDEIIELFKRID